MQRESDKTAILSAEVGGVFSWSLSRSVRRRMEKLAREYFIIPLTTQDFREDMNNKTNLPNESSMLAPATDWY